MANIALRQYVATNALNRTERMLCMGQIPKLRHLTQPMWRTDGPISMDRPALWHRNIGILGRDRVAPLHRLAIGDRQIPAQHIGKVMQILLLPFET